MTGNPVAAGADPGASIIPVPEGWASARHLVAAA
jgi:hypothetical protein